MKMKFKPKHIRSLRKRLRLTQAAFAERLGVTQEAVSNWEHGWRLPSKPVMILMRQLANGERRL